MIRSSNLAISAPSFSNAACVCWRKSNNIISSLSIVLVNCERIPVNWLNFLLNCSAKNFLSLKKIRKKTHIFNTITVMMTIIKTNIDLNISCWSYLNVDELDSTNYFLFYLVQLKYFSYTLSYLWTIELIKFFRWQ